MKNTKKGFTLVELLVVIAIIGTLVGLLLPAVQSAREAARRMSCGNNVKQMSLGIANYESAMRCYPNAGEFKNFAAGRESLCVQSLFQSILAFTENTNIAAKWNTDQPYWSTVNAPLAAANIPLYRCPSSTATDTVGGGFGISDYMPLAYTDIDPTTGKRLAATLGAGTSVTNSYVEGALSGFNTRGSGSVKDGLSKTAIFIEDASRVSYYGGKRSPTLTGNTDWWKFKGGKVSLISSTDSNWTDGTLATHPPVQGGSAAGTCPARWAEGDGASGWSGHPAEESATSRTLPMINNQAQNPQTIGGTSYAMTTNNVGSNDEPYSQHNGVCLIGLLDGSVQSITTSISPNIVPYLVNPNDGAVYDAGIGN
jgi:prepilin-type N-terminal cleavage/methylation domain-containing protein